VATLRVALLEYEGGSRLSKRPLGVLRLLRFAMSLAGGAQPEQGSEAFSG
jgi:hypothetical protein